MKRKLVEHLVEIGLVARDDIQRCVLRAKMGRGSVVDEVIERLSIDQRELAEAMAGFWGMEFWKETTLPAAPAWQGVVPRERAEEHGVLPITGDDDQIPRLAIYDVEAAQPVVEEVRGQTGGSPELVLAPRDLVRAEIARHYNSTAVSGVHRLPQKPDQKALMTRETPTAGLDMIDETGQAVMDSGASEAGDMPTRQIDLETDNPFMDLVQKTAQPKTKPQMPSPSPSRPGTGAGDRSKPAELEEAPEDFFSDLDEPAEIDREPQMLEESSVTGGAESSPSDELDEALDDFDAQLGSDESEAEELLMGGGSSVNWGKFDDESEKAAVRLDSHSGEALVGVAEGSKSGLLPSRRGRSGVFEFPDEEPGSDRTLAEVVAQQRKMIRKLEREIKYQKGLMQTLAELLVEARVISRRKLKKSLKAFKEAQRKKYE